MRDWLSRNRADFERDVLCGFCQAAAQLCEQIGRFSRTQTVSFVVLRALIGEPQNKGLLWRLKDKAHHIFRDAQGVSPAGPLLDWVLGYIFHESLKLMEDAHQRQFYAPGLQEIVGREECRELAERMSVLLAIQNQTVESMRRESSRLEQLLDEARKLFCLYFTGCSAHRPLSRFLHDNDALVRNIFAQDYQRLIQAVYGGEPERMHIEAAGSLLESARFAAAAEAVRAALALNPRNEDALALWRRVSDNPHEETAHALTAPKPQPRRPFPDAHGKSGTLQGGVSLHEDQPRAL